MYVYIHNTSNSQVQNLIIVAWHRVCAPLETGGLGIRALGPLNRVGIICFVWNTMHIDFTWRKFMHAIFSFASKPKYITYTLWPSFSEVVSVIEMHARWIIGKSYLVRFWCSN